MDLNIKNIDTRKADLGIRHQYIPDTVYNQSLDIQDQIVVECDYLEVGERVKFTDINPNGTATIDMRRLFTAKVREIRNLKINGTPVVSAEALLKYPSVLELEALVINVAHHLLETDHLNEDERKNSSSASNSTEEDTSTKS